MSEGRSLNFAGELGPQPYTAHIKVTGGVTGMKYGTLCLTRADLHDLKGVVDNLLCMVRDEHGEVGDGIL